MPIFLDTRGKVSAAIGICDRCRRKFPLMDLLPDPNTPGLRVCQVDRDVFDPWRLPARQPENISLPFTRPDVPLGLASPVVVNEILATEDEEGIETEGDDGIILE